MRCWCRRIPGYRRLLPSWLSEPCPVLVEIGPEPHTRSCRFAARSRPHQSHHSSAHAGSGVRHGSDSESGRRTRAQDRRGCLWAVGTWRGQRCGSLGDAGVFSFQQNKNIQSGEGGAVFTNDERIHARARMYHDVGSYIAATVSRPTNRFVGVNYRGCLNWRRRFRPQLKRLDRKLI